MFTDMQAEVGQFNAVLKVTLQWGKHGGGVTSPRDVSC